MASLRGLLEYHVDAGGIAGAVALHARGDEVAVEAVGHLDVEGKAPMARDSIFRLASVTKPVIAAAVLLLVEEGLVGLHDPIGEWLPELAAPQVVRTPESKVDDVVAAERQITVFDLLTSRAGYGFPGDYWLPQVELLHLQAQRHGLDPQLMPEPDEWLADLSYVPLLAQPGRMWLYNTCSDIQGVLISRVAGQGLPEFLQERLLGPLGMKDTAFLVPETERPRFAGPYGRWSRMPAFPSGAGGLVSTVDDWLRFARMLLARGGGLLTPDSVALMTTDHLTPEQREAGRFFLGGQGWGCGGSVDVAPTEPWQVPGRYGWTGSTGTAAHLTPATGEVTLLFTQLAASGPAPTPLQRAFWLHHSKP